MKSEFNLFSDVTSILTPPGAVTKLLTITFSVIEPPVESVIVTVVEPPQSVNPLGKTELVKLRFIKSGTPSPVES